MRQRPVLSLGKDAVRDARTISRARARTAAMRQLSLIEFPGVLRDARDPSAALAALGGEECVRAATKIVHLSESARLTLNLRPGDSSSSSNIGAQPAAHESCKFLLRVFVDPLSGSSSPRARILGRISRVITFPGISDFQYVDDRMLSAARARLHGGAAPACSDWADAPDRAPTRPRKRARARDARAWRPPDGAEMRTRAALRLAERVRDGAPVGLLRTIEAARPWRFSRTATETAGADLWFRQACGLGGNALGGAPDPPLLGLDRRSDATRMLALPHKVAVDAPAVPDRPHASLRLPAAARSAEARDAMLKRLRELFATRAVWIRRAVLHAVPRDLRRKFVKSAPHVAYSFYGAGPFFAAWVRYGYDPRKHPREARKFQVIEVRCKHPVVLEAVGMQEKDVRMSRGEGDKWAIFEPDFTLAECPTQKNMFLQLCDIQIESVQELVRDEPFPEEFSAKTGHFTQEGFEKVHAAVRKGLYVLAERKVGPERTKRILEECKLRRKKRRLGPRSVLDANFHRTGPIREGVLRVRAVEQNDGIVREEGSGEGGKGEGDEDWKTGDWGEDTVVDVVGNDEASGPPVGNAEDERDASGHDEGRDEGDIEGEADDVDDVHPGQEMNLDAIEGFEIYDEDGADSDGIYGDEEDGDEDDDEEDDDDGDDDYDEDDGDDDYDEDDGDDGNADV